MKSRLALGVAVVLCCVAQDQEAWKLPRNVRPLQYEAQLTIDPAQSAF
jgi:hypothetical protein